MLQCLGFVKRQCSTTVKVSTSNYASLVEEFSYDARVLIDMMKIPGLLVINWDQTGIQYVHVFTIDYGERRHETDRNHR